ncbi:MAG: hypothetical protein ACUVQI_04730 [Thermochromatium sp.]
MSTAAIAQNALPSGVPWPAEPAQGAALHLAELRMLSQLERCLHRGCIIAIKPAEQVKARDRD